MFIEHNLPEKYNAESILLYIISFEITNLLKEIKLLAQNKITKNSPAAAMTVDKSVFKLPIFTVNQIEELQKKAPGYAKYAIAAAMKRQSSLNLVQEKLKIINDMRKQLEEAVAICMENKKAITDDGLAVIMDALNLLKEQESKIIGVERDLKNIAKKINDVLEKNRREWERHREEHITFLIKELEEKGIILSDIEKNELKKAEKKIDDIKKRIKKLKN